MLPATVVDTVAGSFPPPTLAHPPGDLKLRGLLTARLRYHCPPFPLCQKHFFATV